MQLPKTNFDFVANRYKFFALSGLLLAAAVASLATRGIDYAIDFTGGTVLQIALEQPTEVAALRKAVETTGLKDASIQTFGEGNSFAIRVKGATEIDADTLEKELTALQVALGANKIRVDRKDYVGPAVGRHLFRQAMWAIVLSLAGIILYVAFRFENPIWGICGVLALGHDILATYGLFSWTGAEVDLVVVAALLTIAGYSINDTIVIFDRMRENLRIKRGSDLGAIINDSLNETMSRTLITNFTVGSVVLILFLFGGPVIHNFAMAMVFGALVGTYSTVAISTSLVYEWSVRGRGNRGQSQAQQPRKPKPLGKK